MHTSFSSSSLTSLLPSFSFIFYDWSLSSYRYGLYESFKDFYTGLAGPENAKKYQGLIWCAGSASAEGTNKNVNVKFFV